MNTGEDMNPEMDKTEDQHIEWDNGDPTYGHAVNPSSIKRKDSPGEDHLKDNEEADDAKIISDLKNTALSKDSDIGGRNIDKDKGIGGKSL